ncbi:MAG: photosystem II S4 domain protein [Firmicutes bacterium]|jgi:RNA-binding protein YlmH|nr:photosystem II S4 domain protein [Bacillota bacterium]
MNNKERLLSHLEGKEERLLGARIVDLAERAMIDDTPQASDFLDPRERQIAQGVLGCIPAIRARGYGGFPEAERQRLLIYPEHYLTELLEPPLWALEVKVETPGRELRHGDYLGAILGVGIDRGQVGDILVQENGCQAIVSQEALRVLLVELRRVGSSEVSVSEIDLEQLEVPAQRIKEVRTTVASMRLDAVAAFGFGMSRTKMAREIKGERVKLNWKVVTDPAHPVAEGDVISMRGRGRISVDQITGTTRKGRISLLLKRAF